MNIPYDELKKILEEAYSRGWHGTLELRQQVAKELVDKFAEIVKNLNPEETILPILRYNGELQKDTDGRIQELIDNQIRWYDDSQIRYYEGSDYGFNVMYHTFV
jgi:hypothetical protein